MTIIEALKAAQADGKFYISGGDDCDRFIDHEIDLVSQYEDSMAVQLTTGYEYRDGVITGPGEVEFLCQTADEVHAEREMEDDE